MKAVTQGREGEGDDAGVELAHKGADAHCGHDQPRGPVRVADRLGAAGFDQEPAQPARRNPRLWCDSLGCHR